MFIYLYFHETDFQLRTRCGHDQHCALVTEDPFLAMIYDVKSNSILSQSKFFRVVDGLDPDIMHDQLEGVLPLSVTGADPEGIERIY